MPRPMPVPPPVTSATCPLSLTRDSSSGPSAAGLDNERRAPARPGWDHESDGTLLDGNAARLQTPSQLRQVSGAKPERREGRLGEPTAERRELEHEPPEAQLDERPVLRGEAPVHREQVLEVLRGTHHVLDLAVDRRQHERRIWERLSARRRHELDQEFGACPRMDEGHLTGETLARLPVNHV